MKLQRLLAVLTLLAIIAALFTGCQKSSETAAPQEPQEVQSEPAETATEPETEEAPLYTTGESSIPYLITATNTLSYPLTEEEVVITGAAMMDDNFYAFLPEDYFACGYGYKHATEVTGVKFECETYGVDTASTKLGLMIAAEDTPDVVIGLQDLYSTGVEGLFEDEVIYDLLPYIQEMAPDFYAYWESNSTYRALALSESQRLPAIYGASNILGYETGAAPNGVSGIITRADWLEKTGFSGDNIPKTYEQFEEYAIAAKNMFDVDIPVFTGLAEAVLMNGYDLCGTFSVESDGTVSYDLTSDNYKEFIKLMAHWYEEGLLDADFMLNGLSIGYDAALSAGMTLCVCRDAASHMTPAIIENGKANDPDFALQGLPYLGRTEDWENKYGGYYADAVSNGWFITTTCTEDRMPYVLGYANYFFTEAGCIDFSYGEEGVTWVRGEDGGFEYTDLIRNPESLPPFLVVQALNGMQPTGITVPKPNFYDLECQEEANEIWMSNLGDERVFKGVLTSDERQLTGTAMTDISTLQDERLYQFIFGELDIDENWEAYVNDCYNMGLQTVLDAYQAAQDRYVAKFGA